MKRMCKPEERVKIDAWLKSQRTLKPQGRKRFWKRFLSKDTGCRLGANGQAKKTFQSPHAEEEAQVAAWSRNQEEQGFELSPDDLSDEFVLILQSSVWDLERKQEDQGFLEDKDKEKLSMTTKRLEKLSQTHNRKYLKARMCYVCGFVAHNPGNVVPFTPMENEMIIKLSWQAFDWLTDRLARGSIEELRGFVSEPEKLIANRPKIAVVAQDAVPVYLDLSTAKVLVKASSLDERRHRELLKRMIKQGTEELVLDLTGIEKPSSAIGASRRQKNRLTLFMRHALTGLWDPEMETPKGEMLDFVLLSPAMKHARLEDMSCYEPSVWMRDHWYEIDGQIIQRKKGERVGALGSEWRAARRHNPALFYRDRIGEEAAWRQGRVRVWFQPKATEDTIIASWLSDLIVEDTK